MLRNTRRGFTSVELLVVFGVIAIVFGLLMPAVQRARRSADRMSCLNNMKQVALALHNYQSVSGAFPPSRRDAAPTRSWVPYILPYIQHSGIHYDKKYNWDDSINLPWIQAEVPVLLCPSASPGRRDGSHFDAAVCDYSASAEAHPGIFQLNGMQVPIDRTGVLNRLGHTPIRAITDGTSNTFILVECAGRPELWQAGLPSASSGSVDAGWAVPNHDIVVSGWDLTGTGGQGSGPHVMNATNNNEIYSFHSGGANFAFADGSVRFIRHEAKNWVISSLVTKNGGEILKDEEY